jgi:hypothetical protein
MKTLLVCAVMLLCACGGSDPVVPEEPTGCQTDADCDVGVCCDTHCEDLTVSMRACGACGVACGDNDFCTGTECASFSFSALCANTSIRIVQRDAKAIAGQTDDPSIDNDAAVSLGNSLATLCSASAPDSVNETAILQSENSGPLTTGHDDLLIVAGGRVYSYVMDYLDNADVTPVELVVAANGNDFQLVSRSERRVIVLDKITNLSETRDYIVGQAIYDATSGTQILNVYGIFRAGTTTGADYFANLIGQPATSGQRWFVAKLEDGTLTRLAGH